jgi:hypothetical protein
MTLDTALDPAADATGGGAGKARAPDGTCDKAAAAAATSTSRTDPETAQDAAGSEVAISIPSSEVAISISSSSSPHAALPPLVRDRALHLRSVNAIVNAQRDANDAEARTRSPNTAPSPAR